MTKNRRVVISGAGIAGLAIGIYLSKIGWDVIIIEKDSLFRLSMAGIHISASAVKILCELGIHDLADVSSPCRSVRLVNQYNMESLFQTHDRNPSITISRAILHNRLLKTAIASNVSIKMGCQLTKLTVDPGPLVNLHLSSGEDLNCDLVIGADGINSAIRRLMNLDTEKVYQGYLGVGVAYPGTFKHDFNIFSGELGMIGMSNLGSMDTASHHKFLWSHVPMTESRAKSYAKSPALSIGAMAQMYASWGPQVQEELRCIEANVGNEAFHVACIPIYCKPMLTNWSHAQNKVIFIGDAAHAYGPGGQGVTMALEDAQELSQILSTVDIQKLGALSSALAAFQSKRSTKAHKYGVAADRRNKGRLVRASHWIKVWLVGFILQVVALIYKLFGWKIEF